MSTASPRRIAAALLALVLPAVGWAQSVALTGVMGERALIVIDEQAPVVLRPGEARGAVTLISVDANEAVLDIGGQRQTLRVGDRPVSFSGAGAAQGAGRIVLHAGDNGHFFGTGRFNGVTEPFVIDTGASSVVVSAAQADSLGLNYRAGERGAVTTANGTIAAYHLKLDSVRVGEVEVYNVETTVVPQGMGVILLGNSFLSHFRMKQDNGELVLERRF
jgi:aspartyl protease family protein